VVLTKFGRSIPTNTTCDVIFTRIIVHDPGKAADHRFAGLIGPSIILSIYDGYPLIESRDQVRGIVVFVDEGAFINGLIYRISNQGVERMTVELLGVSQDVLGIPEKGRIDLVNPSRSGKWL